MKRLVTAAILVSLVAASGPGASASGYSPFDRTRVEWLQRYTQWLFGDPESSLLTGTCGEVVDGVFFLVPPSKPNKVQTIPCVVPAGMPIVLSHALHYCSRMEAPTDRALVACAREGFPPSASSVSLDGRRVDVATLRPGAFDVLSERKSLYDVAIGEGTGPVRTALAGEFTFLRPLERGEYALEVSADFRAGGGPTFDAVYVLTVYGLG